MKIFVKYYHCCKYLLLRFDQTKIETQNVPRFKLIDLRQSNKHGQYHLVINDLFKSFMSE